VSPRLSLTSSPWGTGFSPLSRESKVDSPLIMASNAFALRRAPVSPRCGDASRPDRSCRLRAARPQTAGRPVSRKVGSGGAISFAGTDYRVGNGHRFEQVEVCLVGDTVEISQGGRIIKTHAARHDRSKEHGAFSTPNGRPHRCNAAWHSNTEGVTQVLEPVRNAGGGT